MREDILSGSDTSLALYNAVNDILMASFDK